MPQRRSLTPSKDALRMRARRSSSRGITPPNDQTAPEDIAGPLVPDGASLDEAVRARAVWDARRAAELAAQEKQRTAVEAGLLMTRARHTEQARELAELFVQSLPAFITIATESLPPEQQPVARFKLDQELNALRTRLAAKIRAQGTGNP